MLPITGVTSLVLSAMVFLSATRVETVARRQAIESARQMAHRYANDIGLTLDGAMTTSRTIASALMSQRANKLASRPVVDSMLRRVVVENPQLLGAWTVWEPDAFDGQDKEWTNKPGHDASGRLVPYWNRATGNIRHEPNVDYDKPGTGDYFQIPRATGKETVINPYIYEIAGKAVLMTSIVAPLLIDGKFVGVAGVGFALNDVQKQLSAIKPFETGYVALLANNTAFVSHSRPEALMKDVVPNSLIQRFPRASSPVPSM